MVFSSLIFLFIFLPIVLFGNRILSTKRIWQNSFLLFVSLFFYAWGEGEKIILMLISILINFQIGKLISKNLNTSKAKQHLIFGVILNLGILFYFKYIHFFLDNINPILQLANIPTIDIKESRLPIGISFYTFQALSYIIDVYRRNTPVQKNVLSLGLYISLFPQLIAGPIVRYSDIENELIHRIESLKNFSDGIRRFIVGLSKKVLIANNIGALADQIFELEPLYTESSLLWIGALTYSLQLYFDFSGYSDMAIGLGKMLGFNFPENFNFPYISQSIQEFWRRWHITLSIWFRDYLYIPLGGNRVSKNRVYINLFLVFLATGLWHGASWNFVIWGLFHGFFIIIERIGFNKILVKLPRILRHLYTLFVVVIAWILFRSENLHNAYSYINGLFITPTNPIYRTNDVLSLFYSLFILIAISLSLPVFTEISSSSISRSKRISYDLSLIILLMLSVSELLVSTYNPFIYFRF